MPNLTPPALAEVELWANHPNTVKPTTAEDRRRRAIRELTQGNSFGWLAKVAGVAPSIITRVIQGRQSIHLDTAAAIAAGTGLKLERVWELTVILRETAIHGPRRPADIEHVRRRARKVKRVVNRGREER